LNSSSLKALKYYPIFQPKFPNQCEENKATRRHRQRFFNKHVSKVLTPHQASFYGQAVNTQDFSYRLEHIFGLCLELRIAKTQFWSKTL
jgi:hypothetical protein